MSKFSMEQMVAYCNQYGFIFQGSEIYGGLANTWDYGPLGTRLKNNIKDAWRYYFIQNRDNSYELDSDILMNPRVWEASGHLSSFTDPLLDCKHCKTRHRADSLIQNYKKDLNVDTMTQLEMSNYIQEQKIPCPVCGASNYTDIRQFNLMFATKRGVTEDSSSTIYLRPENAQGEYVNYLNVMRSMRAKLPFSIGQIGKAFRNEITPGSFTFRTIEFEQMEYQTFCKKGSDDELYQYFKDYGISFFEYLGIDNNHLRFRDHEKLAHYAKAACDIEYLFPFGWGEINGTHNRTDFDLKRHQEFSKVNLEYFDENSKEKIIPYIIESTYGLDRIILAILFESLVEEKINENDSRLVLKISKILSPVKVNVLPLIKNRHGEKATEVYQLLRKHMMASYDESGTIGKRYRRGDAIGTPYAVTIDDETLEKGLITIRDRDTMEQKVVALENVLEELRVMLEI
ncbi:glycine--tRNA ligase [Lachnoclostridium phytofermentans]|uniref:glycine--tRNA ligase n=1 Tax=Lachnoclostridium phytofermentans (strain ATCC 700394 / DSM 18823 / ISDg) TaxID=357809 RepID=A9KII3_LACP7|nr:glycine--tRNA ligase [Lachnoclostridium phytofermentans]ABX42435.1 glycyl-tRNA synthetase [Lachnoclostridium phytofermentans ISDg]